MPLFTQNTAFSYKNSTPTILIPPSPFNLIFSLTCGQIFGWKQINQGFLGLIQNNPFFLEQKGDTLALFNLGGSPLEIDPLQKQLSHFFRWDDDLKKILRSWRKDPLLSKTAAHFPGLRLIRQDPWDCLVKFLLSICSNIPKIEKTLIRLSQGAESIISVPFQDPKTKRCFETQLPVIPSPSVIASIKEEKLRSTGMGFRASYLKECSKQILQGFPLNSLKQKSYSSAKKELMELPGIGEKVADCVLLFSLDHPEAFPVDVWMQKILERYYFHGKSKTPKYLSEWGRSHFGNFAGYVQQYLYHFSRSCLKS